MQDGADDVLVNDLMFEMQHMDPAEAWAALKAYKQTSPFFPHVSDLNKILKPLRAYRAAQARGDYPKMTKIRTAAEVDGNQIISSYSPEEYLQISSTGDVKRLERK